MPWDRELPRNQWICIELYIKMNSLGNSEGNQDGVLRGWLDDEQVFERTNMRFRHVDSLKIEQVWFDVYVGGDFTAEHDMTLYFDNVVVARNRVGCHPGGASPSRTSGTGGSAAAPSEEDADGDDTDLSESSESGSDAESEDGGCGCAVPGRRAGAGWLAALCGSLLLSRRRALVPSHRQLRT